MFRNLRKCIYKNDPSIHSLFEAYFHPWFSAYFFYRIGHFFYKHKLYSIARILSMIGKRRSGAEVHPGATIGKDVFIDHCLGVVIGETTIIKDNVLIFQNVTLGGRGNEKGRSC